MMEIMTPFHQTSMESTWTTITASTSKNHSFKVKVIHQQDQVYHVRVQLADTLVQLSERQATSHPFKVSKSRKRLQQVKKLQEMSESLSADDNVVDV